MRKFLRILSVVIYCAVVGFCAVFTVINTLPAIRLMLAGGIVPIAGGVAALIAGVFAAGFVNVLLHELAHLVLGKLSGFKVVSFKVLGREFIGDAAKKRKRSMALAQHLGGDQQSGAALQVKGMRAKRHAKAMQKAMDAARDGSGEMSYGSCSLISIREGNYRARLLKVVLSGIVMSFLIFAASVATLLLWLKGNNIYLTMFLAPLSIVSAHIFLLIVLPSYDGASSDGQLALGLIGRSDSAIVTLALLNIQTQLYLGKTPSQIDKRLYFDLPVIPDNTLIAAQLFIQRYAYYLDSGDFESAAGAAERVIECIQHLGYKDGTRIYLNVLFDTVYKGDRGRAEALYELIMRDADLADISDLRVLWFYHHKFGGEDERQVYMQLIEHASSEFKGIYLMEKNLIAKLLKA